MASSSAALQLALLVLLWPAELSGQFPSLSRLPRSPVCPSVLCVHGTCDQTLLQEGKVLCECDEGWIGDICNTPCTRTCENGVCGIYEGRQVCFCDPLYVNRNNVCVPRPATT